MAEQGNRHQKVHLRHRHHFRRSFPPHLRS
ncbi:hypothetical protein ACHAXS_006413 [Conticribra weissflogii]